MGNAQPEQSLGGAPSGIPIAGSVDNLFDDINAREAAAGQLDYRCFYIVNDSQNAFLYAARAFVSAEIPGGAMGDIGFPLQSDEQGVTLQGNCQGGTLTLALDGQTFATSFDQTPAVFASNMQASIQTVAPGTMVRGAIDNGAITLTLTFAGRSGNRLQPLVVLTGNDITGCTGVDVTKLLDGSPINAVPGMLSSKAQAPPGVAFGNPSQAEPIMLGDLGPGDACPVWVRRTTPANADGVRMDGFQFRLQGSPVAPS